MPWMVKLRGGAGRIRDGVGADAPMRVLSCGEFVRFENKPLEDGTLIIEECEAEPAPVVEVPQPDPPKPKRRRRSKKAD